MGIVIQALRRWLASRQEWSLASKSLAKTRHLGIANRMGCFDEEGLAETQMGHTLTIFSRPYADDDNLQRSKGLAFAK